LPSESSGDKESPCSTRSWNDIDEENSDTRRLDLVQIPSGPKRLMQLIDSFEIHFCFGRRRY
jgi:hypothetical protein